MSASAVKEGAGARSQVTNLVTWVAVLATLLFLTPLFTNLPEAVLAALIIAALWHILAARKLRSIRLVSRTEFGLAALTLAGVVLIDVLQGMVLGLVFSLLLFIYRSSRPHLARLGRVPGVPGAFTDLARHPENEPLPGILVLRLDAPLYYANAMTSRDQVLALVGAEEPPPWAVVLDAAAQDELDITSAEMLSGLLDTLRARGIAVYAAEVHAPVLDLAARTGVLERLGAEQVFPTVELAVQAAASRRATEPAAPNPLGATKP
jgi:MFS superfamily sulfate permease-like transporter